MRLFKSKKQMVVPEQTVVPERIVATIGKAGYGKTIFLASLFWDSFFTLSRTFQDGCHPYAVRALTEEGSKVFYGNASLLHDLTLPPANPRAKVDPAVLEFGGVPAPYSQQRQSIKLTFHDIAGEVFSSDRLTKEYAPFVANSHDLVFLFDPTQSDFNALKAAELVNLVHRVAGDSQAQNILIAVTKIDELRERDKWWDDLIADYPDIPPSPADLNYHYFRQMDELSDKLREWWTAPEQEAMGLINNLPSTTRFCALSSLGHRPIQADDGSLRLSRKPEPFRVRDPLFWIFRAAGVM
jgi:hypothetical protein